MAAPNPPRISVALSMRNAAETIEIALRSLLMQTCADWELILLDDGSSDGSVAVARRFNDHRIRLIEDGRRLGLAARLNQAIDLARGRYFARMDADDIAYGDRLARQAAYLDANTDLDLIGTGMMVFADDGRPVGLFPVHATHREICSRPYNGFYLAHPTWMGRIEWFRRWRYDANCKKAQDQDMLLRAFRDSRFAVLPEVLVGYRQDRLSVRKSAMGRYYFSKAIWRHARRDGNLLSGAFAMALQGVKLLIDAFAMSTHLHKVFLGHRARSPSRAEAARWRAVWTLCHRPI